MSKMCGGAILNFDEAVPFWVVASAIGFLLVVLGAGIVFVKNHPKANKEK